MLARTSIENEVVVSVGVVENTNMDPPFDVIRGDVRAPADVKKSDASPVVAPPTPDTEIVHTMRVPTRAGFVLLH